MNKIFTLILCTALTANCFAQSVIDFETPETGKNFVWNAYADGEIYPNVANPFPEGINTSATVVTYISYTTSAAHALALTSSIQPVTFSSSNCIVRIMVYKPIISNVVIKFEGAAGYEYEISKPNTQVNQWEELTFDFSSQLGRTGTSLIIIPDLHPGRTQTVLTHFDNIKFSAYSTLPISLNSFTGKYGNNGNQLTWKTSSEINFKGFEIEKSSDGKDFKFLSILAGGKSHYNFTDADVIANQTYYYRLKLVDNDGTFTYSNIEAIKAGLNLSVTAAIYPNPAVNELNVSYTSLGLNETKIVLLDSKGSKIQQLNHADQIGNNLVNVNTTELRPGVYVLQLNNSLSKSSYKFVKQ